MGMGKMQIKKVQCFKTSDGTIFEDADLARNYEKRYQFERELTQIIDDVYYNNISVQDLVEGIMHEIDKLKEIL